MRVLVHPYFLFACPNPKCGVPVPSTLRRADCHVCGTALFPQRPINVREEHLVADA